MDFTNRRKLWAEKRAEENTVSTKEEDRARIEKEVEEYLQAGGKIEELQSIKTFEEFEVDKKLINPYMLQARHHYRNGKSFREIAKILNMNEKTVQGYLRGCKKDYRR